MLKKTEPRPIILVVDDKPANLFATNQLLENVDSDIVTANSGKEALSALLRHDVALILLDVQMPDMDGFEVAAILRDSEATRHIPIIFLTAINQEKEHLSRAYDIGAVDYIFKPFDASTLIGKVNIFLELHRHKQSIKTANRELKISNMDLQNAMSALGKANAQREIILNSAAEGIISFDIDGVITYANPAALRVLKYSLADIIELPLVSIAHSAEEEISSWLDTPIQDSLENYEHHRVYDGLFWARDGNSIPVDYTCAGFTNVEDHHMMGGVLIFQDITVRKNAEKELVYLAHHDTLTNLANRALFIDHVARAMVYADRGHYNCAVLYLDLDKFKPINDSKGHSAGDEVLKNVAERLEQHIRKNDIVARLGGDEFAILLGKVREPTDASLVAQKVIDSLGKPYEVNGDMLNIGTSVGIATYPECGNTPDSLISAADTAMYQAKKSGRGIYRFYSDQMQVHDVERRKLEAELRVAIEQNQFLMHYQPRVDLKNGNIIGVEALLRWNHPERGILAPDLFLGIAEDMGIAPEIGEWVLRTVCEQNREWQNNDIPFSINVSINVSRDQLQFSNFWPNFSSIIEDTGMKPDLLEFELSESSLMEDSENSQEILDQIHDIGSQVSIDHFGTHGASLNLLKDLPIDSIKIDQSYLDELGNNPDEEAIMDLLISMAHKLGIQVIAEEVETEDQYEFLHNSDCDQMQGYYFSKPLTSEEATALLLENLDNKGHSKH